MPNLFARNSFKKGLLAVVDNRHEEAAVHFKRAVDTLRERGDRPNWRYLSYYGLSLARARRDSVDAIRVCEQAATAESHADLYLNLGQVYLLAGKLPQALEAFAQGLRLEPANKALQEALHRFDRRTAPLIPMLPRTHRLNRWLGQARGRFSSRVPKRLFALQAARSNASGHSPPF